MQAVILALGLVGASAFNYTKNFRADPLPLPDAINTWSPVFVAGTQCMNGKETGVQIRRGKDTTKLLLYFQGGGACFNLFTCATASSNPMPNVGEGGIFNFNEERNALKDYSIVFVPYCSGDVFMGVGTTRTVGGAERKFYGRNNLQLVLDRVIPTFPKLTNLVVSGDSAGGVGALGSFDFVVSTLKGAPNSVLSSYTLLDDSGPAMKDAFLTPCLQQIWRDLWGIDDSLPAGCTKCRGQADGGGMVNLYSFLQDKYPEGNFGLLETTRDSIISLFISFGKDECATPNIPGAYGDEFEAGLKDAYVTEFGSNFAAYIIQGSQHTFVNRNGYFEEVHGGLPLHKWTESLMRGDFIDVNPWGLTRNATHLKARYN